MRAPVGFRVLLLATCCGLAASPVRADVTCKPAAPLPQAKCKKDAQCCAGLVCQGGQCREGCRIDGTFRATGTVNAQCETCRPAVSTTSWTPLPDGTGCDDGVACTQDDFCFAGECEHGVSGCPIAEPCTVARCNLETEACEEDPVVCRTPANDCFQSLCSGSTGICVTSCTHFECCTGPTGEGPCALECDCSTNEECEDDNRCTRDICDTVTGLCSNAPISCADTDPRTFDICDPAIGCVHRVVNPCEDSIGCTQDAWDPEAGACANTPLDERCPSDDPCLAGVCDPATGQRPSGCRFEPSCD